MFDEAINEYENAEFKIMAIPYDLKPMLDLLSLVRTRNQKILEEAPAPNLPDATRAGLRSSAAELARSIGYDSAGTVEFVVDDETGDYFFLEMNTRIQVEHTVTEEITGLDLIEIQIRSATGEPLAIEQSQVVLHGHAFEARINAEDPSAGFAPRTGTITHLLVPDSVRWDSGIELGSEPGQYLVQPASAQEAAARDPASAEEAIVVQLDHARSPGAELEHTLKRYAPDTGFRIQLLEKCRQMRRTLRQGLEAGRELEGTQVLRGQAAADVGASFEDRHAQTLRRESVGRRQASQTGTNHEHAPLFVRTHPDSFPGEGGVLGWLECDFHSDSLARLVERPGEIADGEPLGDLCQDRHAVDRAAAR